MVTSDKDFLQLAAADVELFDPMKDRRLDEAYALERYGIKPEKMRDYLALVGDAIDNIPKVPGVGPKTAVEPLVPPSSASPARPFPATIFLDVDNLSAPATRVDRLSAFFLGS